MRKGRASLTVLVIVPLVLWGMLFAGTPLLDRVGLSPINFWVGMTAKGLSASLPRQVNRGVVWESAEAEGRLAVFTFRLDTGQRTSATRNFMVQTRASVTEYVCRKMSLRATLWAGGEMSFRFIDARGHPIGQLDLGRTSCA